MGRIGTFSCSVPDGYESTGMYRPAQKGEYILVHNIAKSVNTPTGAEWPIVRPVYRLPDVFRSGLYLYHSGYGWRVTDAPPARNDMRWVQTSDFSIEADKAFQLFGKTFVAPTDMTQVYTR